MLPQEIESLLHITQQKATSIVYKLQYIPDAPFVLYTIGDIQLLQDSLSLSVIGSRNPSKEAKPKLDHIITPLIKAGYVIISGLAYGVDSLAHERALDYNGKTIAILG